MFSRSPYFVSSPQNSYFEREPDDLARARYLRALQEQRAARQAYADALAEREVQRLEDQYYTNPYVRMNREPEVAQQFLTGDDADDDYGFVHPRIQRQQQIETLRRAERERQRRQLELEEQERQASLEAEEARRTILETRRVRQAAYEAERRALEEEKRRRAQEYHAHRQEQYLNPFAGTQVPRQAPSSAPSATANPSPRTAPAEFAFQPQVQSQALPQAQPQAQRSPQSPALSAIAEISAAAADLQKSFHMPASLEFAEDDSKPKLSYASTNKPVRVYEDALSKLLEKLDAVESAGVAEIRDARRKAVKDIERALEELEGQVEGAWKKQQHQEDDHSNVGSSDGFEMVDPASASSAPVSRARAPSSASIAPPLKRSRAGSTASAAPAASDPWESIEPMF